MSLVKLVVVISVPDIPNGDGNGQSALPTPNENGIYLFDDLNTFELVCNSSACDWMIKSQKRSIFRQDSPITMYLLPKMAEDICTDCGKNQIHNMKERQKAKQFCMSAVFTFFTFLLSRL